MEVSGYQDKCKVCSRVEATSNAPSFEEKSAKSIACQGDMKTEPVFQEEQVDNTYEIWINNKVSGASITGSIVLTTKELLSGKAAPLMMKKLSEEFVRMITIEANQKKLLVK